MSVHESDSVDGLAELASGLDHSLVVLDVGCRWGFDPRWLSMGEHLETIGFEPDADECAALRATSRSHGAVIVEAALGARSGAGRIFVTAEPACSSLYRPLPDLPAERPELRTTLLRAVRDVELTTLDAWSRASQFRRVDFIKLDTQGSELDILRGGETLLRSVRALDIEVEFNPIYEGQPLFGDVDAFLRARGFVLWRLSSLVHYGFPGEVSDRPSPDRQYFDSRPVEIAGRGGQLYWGHAFYVREEWAHGSSPCDSQTALRDACIATAFGFRDLAWRALERGTGKRAI